MKRLALYSFLSLLIANSAVAEPVDRLDDTTEPEDRFTLKPESPDFQRFVFEIPRYGYEDAVKYQDATALFYSTKVIDEGLSFSNRLSTTISLTSNTYGLELGLPISGEQKLHFGYKQDTAHPEIQNELTIGIDQIQSDTRVTQLHLSTNNKKQSQLLYRVTVLAELEDKQHAYWAHINSDRTDVSVGYEARFFDVAPQIDMLLAASLASNEFLVSPKIEIQIQQTILQIGLALSENETPIEAFFGLEFILHEEPTSKHVLRTTSASRLHRAQNLAPNLHETRRKHLQTLWRKNIGFERNQR